MPSHGPSNFRGAGCPFQQGRQCTRRTGLITIGGVIATACSSNETPGVVASGRRGSGDALLDATRDTSPGADQSVPLDEGIDTASNTGEDGAEIGADTSAEATPDAPAEAADDASIEAAPDVSAEAAQDAPLDTTQDAWADVACDQLPQAVGAVGVFPMNSYTLVGTAADGWVAIVGHDAGGLYAMTAICPHSGCVVSQPTSSQIVCPCHGARFTLNGVLLQGPANRGLEHFATKVCDGQVTINAGSIVSAATRVPI